MKTVKKLLAVSALVTITSAANATVWNVQMNANTTLGMNGALEMSNFVGLWNDQTNTGSWSGTTSLPQFEATLNYNQTFTMNEQTGKGNLNPYDVASCIDNQGGPPCQGLQVTFQGTIKNSPVNPADPNDYKTELPFTPYDGWAGQWALQIFKGHTNPDGSTDLLYFPVPMNVTLTLNTPQVPIPATAWLFGSGLLSVAGAARRRRSTSI